MPSEKTATERLRALLDERGVKWIEIVDPTATAWTDGTYGFIADEYEHGKLELKTFVMTPEQAIAATLGRGECQFKTVERFIDARRDRADICECDCCGYRCARGFIQDERFKYCPNCGRKVVFE